MGNGLEFQRLCCLQSVKLLSIFGIVIVAIVLVSQLLALHRSNNDYFQLGNDINGSNWNKESSFKAETDNGKNYSSLGLGFQLGADWFQKSLSNSTLVNDDSGQRKPKNQLALISKLPKSTFHQKQATNGNFNFSSNIHGPSSISSLLLQNWERSIGEKRSQWHSARERELRNAKFQIENSPIIRDIPQVHASIFRNYSKFRRSYDLMKRLLRVYVYREGEKPIFHQPYLRGIYASEGWFMKLMEENKQFHVKDPKKAHLFYLPFSSLRLREALSKRNFTRQKDLENHLDNFIGRISRKYHFWNRSRGADHFLAACHDWAPRLTRKNMDVCVRALCNSNLGRGFKIGKDVSLPVTYEPPERCGRKSCFRETCPCLFCWRHSWLSPSYLTAILE